MIRQMNRITDPVISRANPTARQGFPSGRDVNMYPPPNTIASPLPTNINKAKESLGPFIERLEPQQRVTDGNQIE